MDYYEGFTRCAKGNCWSKIPFKLGHDVGYDWVELQHENGEEIDEELDALDLHLNDKEENVSGLDVVHQVRQNRRSENRKNEPI